MLKLKGYLKPFMGALALAIALLFVQAVCELNLPNFMSDIVNVGIQQSGLEHAAPEEISENGYTLTKLLADDDGAALLEEYYESGGTADNGVAVMTLKDGVTKSEREDLDQVFGLSAWTMMNLLQQMGDTGDSLSSQGSGETANTMGIGDVDPDTLYALIPVLSRLPESQLEQARADAMEMDDSFLNQAGIALAQVYGEEVGMDLGKIQSNYILRIGIWMLLVALISGIAIIIVSYLSSRIAAGVAKKLRQDLFSRVTRFSQVEFDRFSSASLITRSTNDVLQIQTLLAIGIRMLCFAPLMAIGGTFMALRQSVSMGWVILLACLTVTGIISVIFVVAVPKFKALQKLIDGINLITREGLSGLMVIRAFCNEEHEVDRFDTANKKLTSTYLFVNRAMSLMMPAMMLVMNGISVLIIWVGAHHVAEATMQVGDMMAFMQYAMMIIFSFLMISMMFVFIPRAGVAADRISEVLETVPSIMDPETPAHVQADHMGTVEFRNVSFTYEGAGNPAVENVSFLAEPGKTTAFIGSTGAGKSTLLNLIPRFYEATHGDVLVDGVNVKDLTMKELRSHIGYVPQKSVLMGGTIESNLKYGNPELSDEEMNRAAETAQAMEFIGTKEEGFEEEVGQGGTNLSGGQRQRLSIARALAVDPDIYLFDDSFSALDFKTDAALRKALKQQTHGATVLIVAQRVNTIMDADTIYVIHDGRIVGSGTHKELLWTCPEYYEIASSQLSAKELEGRGENDGR